MQKGRVFGAIAALSLSAPLWAADDLSYNFLDVSFVHTSLDDFDVDGEGVAIQGSYAFTDRLYGFAGYTGQDFDFDVDISALELGAGLRWPLSGKVDLLTTASYIRQEADLPLVGEIDDDALGLGLALRGRVAERLEVSGGINYVNFDQGGDDTSFSVGGRYYFNKLFALGADVGFDEDGTTYLLGVRFDFGRK
jgi:hypothetical protein